jgi:microcystin-dependent protein
MKLPTLLLSALLVTTSFAQTTVPANMTYQGRLTDSNNASVPDGNGYEIEVRLWSAPTSGTLLWGSRYTGVPLKSGAFNLILGSGGTPITGATTTDLKAAFSNATVYLSLTATKSASGAAISSPTEILPRQQIFSTPFAFRTDKAEDSTKLGGQPANYYSPTGSIVAFAGPTAPTGWLLCDGSTVTSSAYSALFNVIGTSFGSEGSGTFKLPDLRGRFPLGTNPAPQPPVPTVRSLAQTGGEEAHTLTIAEMPSHGHEERYQTDYGSNFTGPYVAGGNYAASASRAVRADNFNTQSSAPIVPTGGGGAHNTMPPFLVLNYIIKY